MSGPAVGEASGSLRQTRTASPAPATLLVLAAAAGLLAVPAVLSDFYVHLATEIVILALFAMSLNLLFGYAGLLSFGQAGYFAVGAYTCALALRAGWTLIPALAAGAGAAAVAAALVGYLCVRRDEIYFSMVTLAFGQLAFTVAWKWTAVTGGSDGISGVPRAVLAGALPIDVSGIGRYYYLTLVVSGLWALAMFRLVARSPLGLTWQALRENASRAPFLGIDLHAYRLGAFVVSGIGSGIAGALFAPFAGIVQPSVAHWIKSAEPVVMTLLGGPGTFLGPAAGAAAFTLLKEAIGARTEYWPLILGLLIIAVVLFSPGGLAGWWRQPQQLLRSWRGLFLGIREHPHRSRGAVAVVEPGRAAVEYGRPPATLPASPVGEGETHAEPTGGR